MTKYNSFRPGEIWLDTDGKRIQAHGGSVIYIDDTYYFYGENKEKTDGKNGIWHWGVRCYSSKDLYNWTDLGLIIPPDLDDVTSPLHPRSCMDRPHIIYYKAYNLDASEFTQCLSGFKSIPKNLKKIYIGDAKGILTKRNKKSKVLNDFE